MQSAKPKKLNKPVPNGSIIRIVHADGRVWYDWRGRVYDRTQAVNEITPRYLLAAQAHTVHVSHPQFVRPLPTTKAA